MASVTPGYTFSGAADPITSTKLNLLGQPTVSLGTNEVTLANMAQVATNTLLGRSNSGTGDVQAIDLTTSGLGYRTGAGGTITQSTSKSTGVTLDKVCGEITLNNASLASDTTVSFVLTNSRIEASDILIINHSSGGTPGSYTFNSRCASGSATIDVRNVTAGSLGEAIVLRYALIKGATS